jgi:hypothetical protein
LWCYAGLCWRFCSARISSLSFSDIYKWRTSYFIIANNENVDI